MKKTNTIRAVTAALALLLALALTACGNVQTGSASKGTIVVGSKNFTEQYVLGNMYADALKANGFKVEKRLNLGSEQVNDRALQSGQISMYPEYTGTSLVAVLKYGTDRLSKLKTSEATYQAAKTLYAKRKPSDVMLTPASFNNTYGIVVRPDVAKKYGLTNMQQLAEASPKLRFASYSEFQNRSDGYPNMKRNYPAFNFKQTIIVNDIGNRYAGLDNNKADVGIGFTTDGQISAQHLAVMQDPKHIWPFYNPAPVVRADVLKAHPGMKAVLDKVTASLDLKTMQRLNAEVDIQKKNPETVAHDYLKSKGLLKGGSTNQ